MKPSIIAIIPARGESRTVPRKNIRLLNGKPLIFYTLEEARKSKHIGRIIVSTEDDDIAEIAKNCGAEVITRPEELATDEAKTIDVIFHVLNALKEEGYTSDIVVLLQPTSPLRTVNDIDRAIELFLGSDGESVVGVSEFNSAYWSFKIEKGHLKPLFDKRYLRTMRQDLDKVYIPNGAIYISTPQMLYKYESFYCDRTVPYIMPAERSIDIDTEVDFMLAELLMKKYGFE